MYGTRKVKRLAYLTQSKRQPVKDKERESCSAGVWYLCQIQIGVGGSSRPKHIWMVQISKQNHHKETPW